MSEYRRRRFLTDLLFVGGALLAAAGLASTWEAHGDETATPTPAATEVASASPPPPATPTEQLPMPGGVTVAPPVKPRGPVRDPFGNVQRNYAPAGGMPPSPPKTVSPVKKANKPHR